MKQEGEPMDQERWCGVRVNGRRCNQPAVTVLKLDMGRVPMCAACRADLDARMAPKIKEWAKHLAAGGSIDDLH